MVQLQPMVAVDVLWQSPLVTPQGLLGHGAWCRSSRGRLKQRQRCLLCLMRLGWFGVPSKRP